MRPATSEDDAPPAVIWTLAGSDSGSGAGCQADLLTGHDFGVHVCTLITAITAQNSQGVTAVMPVPVKVLQAQWAALINDMPPAVIKIGMLADSAQIQALAQWLVELKQDRPEVRVVLDPVGIASSGDALCAHATRSALAMLWPVVDLLTPNSSELAELADLPIGSPAAQIAACQQLCAAGIGAVLAKGGHLAWLTGHTADLWYTPAAGYWLVLPRLATPHSHGTGCTLASAVACLLALGYAMADAVTLARAYVQQGLQAARAIGQGAGPVAHTGWPHRADCLPHILPAYCVVDSGATDSADDGLSASWQRLLARPVFAPCPPALGFYPVVDSLAWVEKLLAWGVQTLQLRIKRPVDAAVEAEVATAIALARRAGARLFINDHWALALKLGAWGVHLGQEDLATANLPALAHAGIRLGISTHGPFELALTMGWQPSCIALGHIFPTSTKQMPSRPQGIAGLRRQIPLCGSMPTIAIGGIDLARVSAVRATGVGSIAVVSAVTAAAAPQQAVGAFFTAMARVTPTTRLGSGEVFHAA